MAAEDCSWEYRWERPYSGQHFSCAPHRFASCPFPKNHNLVLIGRTGLLADLDLGVNQDIKSWVTYSAIAKRLGPDAMREFLLRELDRAGLGHNTFSPAAIDLVVRSADGVLRKARNLGVGCLVEAVRSAKRTIDIDTLNRVLMQPHWQKDADLADY